MLLLKTPVLLHAITTAGQELRPAQFAHEALYDSQMQQLVMLLRTPLPLRLPLQIKSYGRHTKRPC